jgi:hypothetical protein
VATTSGSAHLNGGCQCGAVRYALKTPPEESSICHCRMCQKASGQPFMALARVKLPDLVWTRGAPAIFASSNLAERGFCKDCGTPLTYRFFAEDNISVAVGSLDDPRAAPPTIQYGVEGELPWCASLPTLPRRRTEEFLTPDQAARFQNHQHPDHD